MPQDTKKAREQWLRYVYARDTGHNEYVTKAVRCEDFVAAKQWDEADKAKLAAARRPALTINKTLITVMSITGEQIETRSEISFRPRYGAPSGNAEVLTKLFRFISDSNQLNWVRSDVFSDGVVTSRGYYDIRLGNFDQNTAGEIVIRRLNPRNVLPDPDATSYDPEEWNDVIYTSWMTADDIALHYSPEDAEALKGRGESSWAYGFDSIDSGQDRFGGNSAIAANVTDEMRAQLRNIRVIERQHRVMTRQKYFVEPRTGRKRVIPDTWTRDEIAKVASDAGLIVSEDLGKRIRWTVTADDLVLHDEWSPYRHFTIVPYFPVFRNGTTIGVVENLLDPQELLNKTLSQELHVVNTMANSGWKVRSNVLMNMSMEELEQSGARTGLVLEVNGDPDKDVVKITPNAIPTGLDRISFKAENFIKSISGRGDSVMGLDRADVSGKAIGEKKESSDVTLRTSLDNLDRTDHMLARVALDIIQRYYTDPRIMNITRDDLTGELEAVSINWPDPRTGEILHDLSLGVYDTVVISQAAKRTLEESQFEQGVALRELGIPVPDKFLIQNSNLVDKTKIIAEMEAAAQSPEAQMSAKADMLAKQLSVAELRAKVSSEEAEALHKRSKVQDTLASAAVKAKEAGGSDNEMELAAQKHAQEMQMMREKHAEEMKQEREKFMLEQQMRQQEARDKRMLQQAEALIKVKQAAAIEKHPKEVAMNSGVNGGGAPGAGKPGEGGAKPQQGAQQ
ncbi:MAG TPA: hypothetical protein VD931_22835 [Baekduia sp.]|nr:hypothetical protein [Baekduia sp.]